MFGFLKRSTAPAPVTIIERKSSVPKTARRTYTAAGDPPRYADFRSVTTSADYDLMHGLSKLRNRARFLAKNSSTMKRYLQLLKDNVVGPEGFHLRVRVRKGNGDFDEVLNKRVQDAFWRWSMVPTTCGKLDHVELSELAICCLRRDGEFFAEIVRNPRYQDGIAINPLDADLIDETLNTVYPPTGNQIKMGVEVDQDDRPVAYHVLTQHPGDPGWYWSGRSTQRKYRRLSADRIIHVVTNRDRPGQTRGEPPAGSVAFEIKMLDGYREAEVTGRRIAASTMGFFVKQLNSPASKIEALADDVVQHDTFDEFQVELEPGTFKELPEGYDFKQFDAKGSSVDYKQFEQQIKRSVAMGLGISAFSLCMETDGVSYSTARTVVIEDRDFYRGLQRLLREKFWHRIFKEWVMAKSLMPDSPIPPTRIATIIDNFLFRGRGWAWVDPAKDVTANAEAIATGQTSPSRVAAERGIDFDDLLDELEADFKQINQRKLPITFGKLTQPAPQDKPDADAENGDGV